MSASKQPLVRRPGPGWQFIGNACWKHDSGVGVHILGMAFMPDGTVRSASEWPASEMADGYIRLAGGNRKRGLMMWALALHQIQKKSRRLVQLFGMTTRDLKNMANQGNQSDIIPCFRCQGAGWCWCDEMPNRAGHDPTELVVDDTRYTCPDCGGSGKTKCDTTEGPCSCGAWH